MLTAAFTGNPAGLQDLFERGGSVDAADSFGRTLGHYLAYSRTTDALPVLLRAGVSLGKQDVAGRTPLHIACAEGNERLVHWILSLPNGMASVSVCDKYGWTPLHAAAARARMNCVEAILARLSADDALMTRQLASTTLSGKTPLHLAARVGAIKIVGSLLANGAPSEQKDANGLLAIDLLNLGDVRIAIDALSRQANRNSIVTRLPTLRAPMVVRDQLDDQKRYGCIVAARLPSQYRRSGRYDVLEFQLATSPKASYIKVVSGPLGLDTHEDAVVVPPGMEEEVCESGVGELEATEFVRVHSSAFHLVVSSAGTSRDLAWDYGTHFVDASSFVRFADFRHSWLVIISALRVYGIRAEYPSTYVSEWTPR